MAGLQGVGKTTACGKLALAMQKKNKRVLMVATDVYRPAAIDQLVSLGERIKVQSLFNPWALGKSECQKTDSRVRVRVIECVRGPLHFSGNRSLAHPEQLRHFETHTEKLAEAGAHSALQVNHIPHRTY